MDFKEIAKRGETGPLTLLSAMRTGAATGIGAKYGARPDSETAAIVRAGVQARTQLEAIELTVHALKDVQCI